MGLVTKPMSPNRPTIQELEDWCEMLMRYMMRHEIGKIHGKPMSLWHSFQVDYPPVAAEMEEWLERRH